MNKKCQVEKQSLATKTQGDVKYPKIVEKEYERFRGKALISFVVSYGKELVGKIILTEDSDQDDSWMEEKEILAVSTEEEHIKVRGKSERWINLRKERNILFVDVIEYPKEE